MYPPFLSSNRSREANALKEQVGESVKYVESIVKLFDKVAVKAVENYQATVAVEKSDINGLTYDEKGALFAYKSGGSYYLNAKLRENIALDENKQSIVDSLDRALEKLPTYKGKVYRNIQFDGFGDEKARDAFVAKHVVDEVVLYDAYTSSSTAIDGYVLDGDFVVHLEIESVNGKNVKGYGNNFESEVLFVRESQYVTDRIAYDQYGTPTIYLTEEAYGQQTAETQTAHRQGTRRDDKRNNTGEPRTRTHTAEESQVQSVRTPDLENVEMQSALSAGNSEGDNHGEGVLQRVQAEVSTKTSSEGFNKQYKNMSRWLKRVNSKEEQSFDSVDEDKAQEQSRAYTSDNKYSYEWFVSKRDMTLTSVNDNVIHNRTDIVTLALKNAASVGYTNQNDNAVVHVNDIDTDIVVHKRSLVHGLNRRMNTQAPVLVEIGNVLKNAIRVNELIPRTSNIKNAYVLIGVAQNQDGNLYMVSFVVNKYSNEVSEISVLYSANAKKEPAALLPKITDESATPTDSTISIAHLLGYVNRSFPDILPESVFKHFGNDVRPKGIMGKDALYQQRTTTLTDREVLAMAADKLAERDLPK